METITTILIFLALVYLFIWIVIGVGAAFVLLRFNRYLKKLGLQLDEAKSVIKAVADYKQYIALGLTGLYFLKGLFKRKSGKQEQA